MVVADGQPRGDPPLEAPKLLAHTSAKRLERLEAVAHLRAVDADALRRTVIDGDEDSDLALVGGRGRGLDSR
jgi:hypothetical protein